MLKFNVELADKVLAAIKKNPQEWDQGIWAEKTECDTSFCFAGWTVRLADGDEAFDWEEDPFDLTCGMTVPERAAQLLGLDWGYNYTNDGNFKDARKLFATSNSLEDLKRIVDVFAGRREE